MNLPVFSAKSTNIFPIVNSVSGGQLATEYNLRCRESVAADSSVQYWIGTSYTHSSEDFKVTYDVDSVNNRVGDTAIIVHAGRAVVNGHYIESLTDVRIDMYDLNKALSDNQQSALTGSLSIGLVAVYSTEQTMAGTLRGTISGDGMYEGIQLVILPYSQFKTPIDTPTDPTQVTAHLRLADFTYRNGKVNDLKVNDNMYKVLSADRISDTTNLVDSTYISKKDLNPDKIYTFAGYGVDTEHDTWCDSIDSLIVWDNAPTLLQGDNPGATNAGFHYVDGMTYLLLPHKQPDNFKRTSGSGTTKYYADKVLRLPEANFDSTQSGGVVTPAYTQALHAIRDKVDNFYSLGSGSMRGCIDLLESRDPNDEEVDEKNKLPAISTSWVIGDYIFVVQDDTVEVSEDATRGPSTLYVVLPGYVQSLEFATESEQRMLNARELAAAGLTGTMLDYVDNHEEGRPDSFDYTQYVNVGDFRGEALKDYFVFSFASDMSLLTTQPADWNSNYANYYQYSPQAQQYNPVQPRVATTYLKITTMPTGWNESVADPNISVRTAFLSHYVYTTSTGDSKHLYLAFDPSVGPTYQWDRIHSQGWTVYQVDTHSAAPYFNAYTRVTTKPADWNTTYSSYYTLDGNYEYIPNAESNWNTVNASMGVFSAKPKLVYYSQVSEDPVTSYLYYRVAGSTRYSYSEPLWLTGEMPMATEEIVGGFLNVPEDTIGGGYIYRDATGHLRLLDYTYLASGLLAYQLGQDYTTSTAEGSGLADIQAELDEYVNNRIAFANSSHISAASRSSDVFSDVISVTINLSSIEEDDGGSISIMNIDSRFNTAVKVNLVGECNNYIINFINCEKLIINNQITSSTENYTLNLYNCNLYYDPSVMDLLGTISGLSLWYTKYASTDMDLVVEGMTVETNEPTTLVTDTYWTNESPNDNHYLYALKSITFADNGTITGCKLLVGDDITGNNALGKFASIFKFTLPQTDGLRYPTNLLPEGQPLIVTGKFISCYKNNASSSNYLFKDTSFTARSQYTTITQNPSDNSDIITEYDGQIAFLTDIYELSNINGISSGSDIAAWRTGQLHHFAGGTCE